MDKDTHANLRQKKSGVAILPTGKSRCQSRDDYQVQKWTVHILFVIPWTVAHQTRLSMEFSRQEYWSRKPFPSPGDLSNPRIKPRSPALQAVSLPAEPPGKPFSYCRCSVTQSSLTLCNPMDCSLPGSSVHRILQARILERVAIPFSRGSFQPKDRTWVSCVADRFFAVWATREALAC